MVSRSSPRVGSAQFPLWLLFAVTASAQSTTTAANQNTNTNTANTNTNTNTANTNTNTRAATATTNTNTNTNTQAATTGRATTLTDLPDINASSSQTTTASSVNLSDAPSLTTTTASNQFILTGAPTIAGVGIPTQVIPYTAGAAFMQKSSLPQGTVFIIVGAILGFFGACVLLWRGMTAYSLHRSVKKAQSAAFYGGGNESSKMLKGRDKSGMYGMTTLGTSTASVDNSPPGKKGISGHGGGGRLAKASAGARGQPSLSLATGAGRNSNLFFSPTAGAGSHVNGLTLPASRTSAYMPAGYYSSPSATAPAGGAYSTQIGATSTSSLAHLNPLGPARAGYMPTRNSPPESPHLHPRGSSTDMRHRYDASTPGGYSSRVPSQATTPIYGGGHSPATSQINLHAPGGTTHGGRAPSANLEDMFDGRR